MDPCLIVSELKSVSFSLLPVILILLPEISRSTPPFSTSSDGRSVVFHRRQAQFLHLLLWCDFRSGHSDLSILADILALFLYLALDIVQYVEPKPQ